jgi:hypothetical protein
VDQDGDDSENNLPKSCDLATIDQQIVVYLHLLAKASLNVAPSTTPNALSLLMKWAPEHTLRLCRSFRTALDGCTPHSRLTVTNEEGLSACLKSSIVAS